ncbi:TraB/GumN family protein [Acuticoccus sp. M5D2P5]|uniref:TraB/GumN family protein n=1 Tax=Acuticoccus kalidii TaxID=2910977 RepID=UPI001F247622|nr:TraB/GumN family protein [Acuticoccus kalidii]MCF3935900.1 TraB/GumN family protein [Acuticoccus kalidii]
MVWNVGRRRRPARRVGRGGALAALALAGLFLPLSPVWAECVPPASDAEILADPDVAAAIDVADATMVNAEGRLWRVETDPPSFLIGTFHIAGSGIEDPGAQLSGIVEGAKEFFIEVDQDDFAATLAEWQSDPSKMMRPPWDRLSDGMSPAEIAAAREVLAHYGMPFEAADQMRPFMVVGILSIPPCALATAGREKGLDQRLEAIAAENGVPVTALESVAEQFALFEGNADETDAIIRMLLAQADIEGAGWAVNLALYRAGHIGALWTFGLEQMREDLGAEEADRLGASFMRRMITNRNHTMVDRMLPGLREGGRVAAIGALHLPGEEGLVTLLREAGFTVTPVAEETGAPL